MKYAVLTNPQLLTPEINQEILELAKHFDKLKKNVYITGKTAVRPVSKIYDPEDSEGYKYFEDDQINGGDGFFAICPLPHELEQRIYDRIPTALKIQDNVRIRLQVLQNFKLFPHVDKNRGVSLFTMISENEVDCVFWNVTEPHEFRDGHLPNPELIQEQMRFRVSPGETWLFDHNEIHGTTESSDKLRITINISYGKLTIADMIKVLDERNI